MNIIFCISNLSVPATISIIANSNEDFIIITDQENIKKFFSEIYDENKIWLIKGIDTKNKWLKPFKPFMWLFHKNNVWKQFKEFSSSKVYFFFNGCGYFESWLIKKLSKNNSVYYAPDLKTSSWEKKYTFFSLLKLLQIYLTFGIIVKPLYTGVATLNGVSDYFLNKINAHKTEIEINNSFIKKLISQKFNINKDSILYLTGGMIELNIIEKNEFIEKTDLLIQSLQGKSIYLKAHPRLNFLHSKENELPQLPYYIPANLLVLLFNVVIGYSTTVLFEAANNNCTVISLLNYYKPVSEERQKIYISLLKENLKNGKEINFPNKIEEIIYIIG